MFIKSVIRLTVLAFLLSLGFQAAAQTSVNFTEYSFDSTSEDIRYSCQGFTMTVTTGATPSATLNASCNSAAFVSGSTTFSLEPAVSVSSTDSTLTWNGTGGTGFVATCTNPEIKSESTGTEDTLVLTAKCDSTETTAVTTLRLDSRLKNSSGSLAVK